MLGNWTTNPVFHWYRYALRERHARHLDVCKLIEEGDLINKLGGIVVPLKQAAYVHGYIRLRLRATSSTTKL